MSSLLTRSRGVVPGGIRLNRLPLVLILQRVGLDSC